MKHQAAGGEIQVPPASGVAVRLFGPDSIPSPAGRDSKGDTVRAPRQSEPQELIHADVVRLAQQGDADAFKRIYQLHSRKVHTICLRMVRNLAEAEDLTQEVFLQLFRKIHMFRGESAFSTWLHRISVNVVLMRFRKKTLAETSFDVTADPDEDFRTSPNEFGHPDLRLNGVIDRITLQAAINELAPGYKATFMLHDIQGYKHNEIAEILGCTVGSSKSQVHKARMRLRELLRDAVGNHARRRRKSIASSPVMDRLKYPVDCANA
jgi:RNA polymerase sigma-70 factor, ECF subfamily